jgi:signal peptidase I
MNKVVGIVISILFLLVLAPAQLGGRMTYAIITGNSMEPGFKRGDLILALSQAKYSTDDIVLYDHPEIGLVFHRIIGVENNHFVFKGDNNSWIDSFQAAHSEIRGKHWLTIPNLGKSLSWVRSAEGISITSLTIGALMIGTTVSSRNDPQRPRGRRSSPAGRKKPMLSNSAISARDAFILSFAITPVFILLGIFAFINPAYVPIPANYPYQHVGEFNYASTGPADVYDGGQLQPGDPIFRRISDSFDVQFTYFLLADGLSEARGTYSMSVTVGEDNGWNKVVEIIPPTPFEGGTVSFSAPIEINDFQAVVDNMELATGMELGQYKLIVQPTIHIQGLIHSIQWQADYSPVLPFLANDIQVQLENRDLDESNQLSQTETGAVFGSNLEVAHLNIFGFSISIYAIRILLALLIPALLILVFVTGWNWFFVLKADRVSQIAGTYGPKLVDVTGRKGKHDSTDIQVYKIEDLARIADREGATILHEVENGSHYYFVDSQNGTYIYRMEASQS